MVLSETAGRVLPIRQLLEGIHHLRQVMRQLLSLALSSPCSLYSWVLLWFPLTLLVLLIVPPFRVLNRLWLRLCQSEITSQLTETEKVVAFFHPYCDSGGGGERVLWVMIDAMLRDPALRAANRIVIYSASSANRERILQHVHSQFAIDLREPVYSSRIHFVRIYSVALLEARWYPVATMVGQSLGSVIVGVECFTRLVPDVYFDTMGAPFTYPLFRYLGGVRASCKIVAYVHYPLISSDMLQRVRELRPSYNNNASISGSTTVSRLKVWYYYLFAWLYRLVGKCATVVYVNSSWTEGHVAQMWGLQKMESTAATQAKFSAAVGPEETGKCGEKEEGAGAGTPSRRMQDMTLDDVTADLDAYMCRIAAQDKQQQQQQQSAIPPDVLSAIQKAKVKRCARGVRGMGEGSDVRFVRKLFPPCSTAVPAQIPINTIRDGRSADPTVHAVNTRYVLSVGQFRPEKDHMLQLRAFAIYCDKYFDKKLGKVTLVLLGSTRNTQDEQLVQQLKQEAENLGLGPERVKFVQNAPFVTLQAWLAAASVGLHTMWNEHFGISVVEMMAAGLVVVAHDSGGPKSDIVTPPPPPHDATTKEVHTHTGYLATSAPEYAHSIALALADGEAMGPNVGGSRGGSSANNAKQNRNESNKSSDDNPVRLRARVSVQQRFSDEAFAARVREDFTALLLEGDFAGQ